MDRYPLKPANFAHSTILVVEDNADHWAIIYAALHQVMPKAKAIWVADEQAALRHLTACLGLPQDLPRLILLDLYLPHREQGLSLLKQLKAPASLFRAIPVVMLSASEAKQDIWETYDWAGTSYVVKPTDGPRWLALFNTFEHYWEMTVTLPTISGY